MDNNFMNSPEPHNGQAYIQLDSKTGKLWVFCPWCGKKAFPISEGAVIQNQKFLCRGSNCRKEFVVNVR